MPSVVQTQTVNSAALMFKDRSGEPIVSAFTAVNGRTSPPFARKANAVNGQSADGAHVRPYCQSQSQSQAHAPSEPVQDQKPVHAQEWNAVPRPQAGSHYSLSPPVHAEDRSPLSPPKRKRSGSDEDEPFFHSPAAISEQGRRRFNPRSPSESSPDSYSHGGMEQHQRTLPPINRHGEFEKPWPSHEGQTTGPHSSHYRDSRDPSSNHTSHLNGIEHSQHQEERPSNMEITRAGIPVDPKKRKRQFANRTKTGCGTCRRRKKKCDEAKPECNNCTRGGFPCSGYASKIPWPKIGMSKSHPPLQAKDQYALEPQHLFHSHGTSRESYPDTVSSDGARARPIVVEEHERQAPQSSWGNWGDHARHSHAPEHSRASEYSHPPPTAHSRPLPNPSSEQYPQPPAQQGPPPQRQQRVYNHTPQSMSHVAHTSPEAPINPTPTEPQVHHQVPPPTIHQGHHQGPSTGLPGPPRHYASVPPPRREKTEKERMLSGEAFLPYHPTLLGEREHCSNAVFRFNMTSNERVQITREERHRHLQALVAAKWIPRTDTDAHHRGGHTTGYVGTDIHVDTPFHCDYGYNLEIRDMVTIGPGCKFLDSGRILIGRNSRIGANVIIDTQTVPADSKSVKGSRGTVVAAKVSIGENVYIGANATILGGVNIGTGAIIHPGSVVMKDIPRDCVVRGNPPNVQPARWVD